jgi:hypothetical protein
VGLVANAGQYSLEVNERLLTTPANATLLLRDVLGYKNTVAIYEQEHAGEPVPQAVVDGQRKIDEESWWPKPVIDNRTRVEAHELASVVVLVVPAQEVYDYDPKTQNPSTDDLRPLLKYLRKAQYARDIAAVVPVLCVVTRCDRLVLEDERGLPCAMERVLLSTREGIGKRLKDNAELALGLASQNIRLLGWLDRDVPDYRSVAALKADPRAVVLSSILMWAAQSGAITQSMRADALGGHDNMHPEVAPLC